MAKHPLVTISQTATSLIILYGLVDEEKPALTLPEHVTVRREGHLPTLLQVVADAFYHRVNWCFIHGIPRGPKAKSIQTRLKPWRFDQFKIGADIPRPARAYPPLPEPGLVSAENSSAQHLADTTALAGLRADACAAWQLWFFALEELGEMSAATGTLPPMLTLTWSRADAFSALCFAFISAVYLLAWLLERLDVRRKK